jgi:signal transduction histidine kinase
VTDITPALFYFGDEESIRKLITILLDNAIKYSPEGESIELTVNKQGRAVHVKVSNVAPNISAEETRFIFDRFYRSDPARSSGGFGIGLSIAGAIVNQHKGKIIATKQFERLVIEASLL